jgi:hypothetical protein
LGTPPFVTTCIFKDDVDEGTSNEVEYGCIKLEIEFAHTQDEDSIHNPDNQ